MEHLRIYNILDSTNREAQRLLSLGPVPNGTTLLAKQQTEGKGQYGRSWQAESGSHLAMSIILQPENVAVTELPMISMQASLGIVRALDQINPCLQPKIKWPNDIYSYGKKMSGILIENSIAGSMVRHIIIGIGLNVNETQFPPELPNAVSIYMASGEENDLFEVAQLVRQKVIENVDTPPLYWKEDYDAVLFGLNEEFDFDLKGERIIATMKGVNDEGKIVLATRGELHDYYSHEIKWILP